jgi:hypothetical protein
MIAEAPVLEDAYQTRLLDAFWKLSTCRQLGMGAGPIPWDAIDRWALRKGYDADQIEYDAFVYIIGKLDAEYLEHKRVEYEREQAKAKNGKSGSVRKTHAPRRGRRGRRGR